MYVAAGARAVSVCGDVLATTALVLVLQAAGAGGIAVAALLLAGALPLVVLAPLAGRVADRYDSRSIIVAVASAQAATCAVLAVTDRPAGIVGLVALLSAGVAVLQPTMAALTPDMVGRENLPRAAGIGQSAAAAGMLVAPALAGLLVGHFGPRVPLLIDAGSFLAVALAGLLIRTRRGGAQHHTDPTGAAPAWSLRSDHFIAALVVAVSATAAMLVAVNVVDVFFVVDTLGAGPTWFGAVTAAWTAGLLLGGWTTARLVARLRLADGPAGLALLVTIGTSALPVALAALCAGPGWLLPLWIAGGLSNGACNVLIALLIGRRIPAAARGRAFARLNAAVNGASVLGYAAGGLLLSLATPRTLIAACGVAGLATAVAFLPYLMRAMRRLPAEPGTLTPWLSREQTAST